jgi:hypothetical protein
MSSSTEEAEDRLEKPEASLKLLQVLEAFKTKQRTTPKQLAELFGIEANTAREHLRRLERLGHTLGNTRAAPHIISLEGLIPLGERLPLHLKGENTLVCYIPGDTYWGGYGRRSSRGLEC